MVRVASGVAKKNIILRCGDKNGRWKVWMSPWDEAFNSLFAENAEEDSCHFDVTTPLPAKAER